MNNNIKEALRCRAQELDVALPKLMQHYAMEMEYPTTLPHMPAARLLCYSAESVVAEKWQAMVQLKEMNSRMKDIYDLWFLSRTRSFAYTVLKEAVARTFARRGTDPATYLHLTTPEYMAAQQPEWAAYVRKLKAASYRKKAAVSIPSRDMAEVMAEIIGWLEPVMQDEPLRTWKPGKGWK